jgi:hypothetical protein
MRINRLEGWNRLVARFRCTITQTPAPIEPAPGIPAVICTCKNFMQVVELKESEARYVCPACRCTITLIPAVLPDDLNRIEIVRVDGNSRCTITQPTKGVKL